MQPNNILKKLQSKKYLELLPNFENERTQKFTSLVLTLLALSFFGLFAVNPTLSTIAKLKRELADNEFVDQQLQQKINNLNILSQKYSILQNDIPLILSSVPKTPDAPLLLAQIQAIAKNSNIQIQSMQTFQVETASQTQSKNKYMSFSFSLSGGGGYNDISKFISTFIDMQRIISIDVLTVTKKSGETNNWQISIRGTAYFKN